MRTFAKITYPDQVNNHNLSVDHSKADYKGEKNGNRRPLTMFNQKEEDDTTIYEYDYDCLKRKELLGHACIEHKKR